MPRVLVRPGLLPIEYGGVSRDSASCPQPSNEKPAMNYAPPLALGLVAVCASFLALVPSGPGQERKPQPALAERLDEQVQGRVRADGFSGAVLVARDGRPILARGYGPANRDYDLPNTPRTKFRIGSVTKPITAVAILTLVQQGKLRLDDPARHYVPEIPAAWEK